MHLGRRSRKLPGHQGLPPRARRGGSCPQWGADLAARPRVASAFEGRTVTLEGHGAGSGLMGHDAGVPRVGPERGNAVGRASLRSPTPYRIIVRIQCSSRGSRSRPAGHERSRDGSARRRGSSRRGSVAALPNRHRDRSFVPRDVDLVTVTKGIEAGTCRRMTEVLDETLEHDPSRSVCCQAQYRPRGHGRRAMRPSSRAVTSRQSDSSSC